MNEINFTAFHTARKSNLSKVVGATTLKTTLIVIPICCLLLIIQESLKLIAPNILQIETIINLLIKLLFFIAILYIFTKSSISAHTKNYSTFKAFAISNHFIYTPHSIEVPHLKLFGDTLRFSETINDIVSGIYKDKKFRIYIYQKRYMGYISAPVYCGVLEVVTQNKLIQKIDLEQKAKALNGSEVEVKEDKIYFVTQNGMDMSPGGIANLFKLIEITSEHIERSDI